MTTTLDVFISSKMQELRPERDALYALFPTLDYGDIKLRAWVFETDAPASEQSIRESYLKALENSALYLGLFWNQYGAYTIDEFDRATEWGMERHIYVKDVDAKNREPKLDEFLKKYGDVTSGITPKWFKTTDELCAAVKNAIETWIEERLRRRASAASAVHLTDPDDILDRAPKLFGRDDLRAQIAAELTGNDPLLLQGFGGMGKTALAAEVAADWLKAGKGAALWLKAGSASAEDLFQALAQPFGAAQTVAAQTGDALLKTVRSLLKQTGITLLVLDDCWNAKALTTVLKAVPSNLPVLLTARRAYGIRNTHKVDALAPDQAAALLGYHAAQDLAANPDAQTLCQQLGYLPFALRIAGINLQHKYHLTPAELSRKIENTAHDLTVPLDFSEDGRENVASLLQISLDALDAETRTAFIACGAFFAPSLTAEMMAFYQNGVSSTPKPDLENLLKGDKPDPEQLMQALMSFLKPSAPSKPDSSAAESALTTLAHHGLIEHIPPTENAVAHYRLHDLAYSYARAQNGETEHHRALDACLAYLKHYAEPNLPNFAALHPELSNLLAAADWAFQIGRYADMQWFPHHLYFGNSGWGFLAMQGFSSLALGLLSQAAEAAARQGDKGAQGVHLGNLGNAYSDLGQTQRAIQYYEQVLEINREMGDKRNEGNALGNLGLAYRNLGQTQRAIEYHEQALAISRQIGDKRAEGQDLGNLGLAYSALGQTQRAIDYYEQDLVIAREIGDKRGEGAVLGNLGAAYRDLGQTQRAMEYYQQSIVIQRAIGDRMGEANNLNNIGTLHDDRGDYPQAITYYEQARMIFAEIGAVHMVALVDDNLAIVRAKMAGDSGDPEP